MHPYLNSHTGMRMKMGQGALILISKNQKINTRSRTESGSVAVDEPMMMTLLTKLFLTLKYLKLRRTPWCKTTRAQ